MIGKLGRAIAKRRAARNFVRLYSGELTEQEAAAVGNWRDGSDHYQHNFLSSMQVMAGVEALAENPDLLALARQSTRVSPLEKARDWLEDQWPRLATAALLVVAAGVGFYTLYQQQFSTDNSNIQRYVTRVGEQKIVNLEDGSVITLNTTTQLLVDITEQSRRVILERGEVYFDIAGDPDRPFTVELGTRAVSVLGTEFNIRQSPEKFSLAVVEGTVAIHGREETASATAPLLTASEDGKVVLKTTNQRRVPAGTAVEFSVDQQTLTAYNPTNINRLHSWRTGTIRFEYEPLYKVAQELNRYLGKKILIEDDAIMNMKIYATVRLDRLNMVLEGLENTLPIKVIRHVDRTVIVGDESKILE